VQSRRMVQPQRILGLSDDREWISHRRAWRGTFLAFAVRVFSICRSNVPDFWIASDDHCPRSRLLFAWRKDARPTVTQSLNGEAQCLKVRVAPFSADLPRRRS